MTANQALNSIIFEVHALIRRHEGKYAQGVISDFENALGAADSEGKNLHKVAYQWLQMYKTGKQPKRVEEQSQPKAEAPKPLKKQTRKEWHDYIPTGNKFAEMWHQTNILTGQYKFPASVDKKMAALKRLIEMFDTDTKDHFRMTLCQILRDEPNQDVRREAIYLLAQRFKWSEVEWTFWAHEKRQSKDYYMLVAAEAWCKSKVKDDKSLREAITISTMQFLADAIR
jgi:hypothetical protein